MPDQEQIELQKERLAIHRRTLMHYLRQEAILGSSHVPPAVLHGIGETRDNINRIKAILRAWGVPAENHPDDGESPDIPQPMLTLDEDDEERRNLRELVRAYERRLRVLELQAAKLGINTPPEIITEIEDIRQQITSAEAELARLTPKISREAQRQHRGQALAAFYAKNWELAEELLEQVIQATPSDQDVKLKLDQVQRQLDL